MPKHLLLALTVGVGVVAIVVLIVARAWTHRAKKTGPRTVADVIAPAADSWTVATADHPTGRAFLRYREGFRGDIDRSGYDQAVTITWSYGAKGADAMPDDATSSEMERFEILLVPALENDASAALVVVVTFDGARQWTFYATDVDELGRRLSELPDYHGKAYPIEITAKDDPTWSYALQDVLGGLPPPSE